MPRLSNGGSISSGNFSGVGGGAQTTTATTTAHHPSYLISGQNATKRNSNSSIAPILRTTAGYAPSPSSHNGSGLSELASLVNRGAPMADPSPAPPSAGAPQQQRSSMQSFASPHIRGKVSRNIAGLLSPRSTHGLPLTTQYNNNDQAPTQPSRGSIMRAAESGKGNLLPMRGTAPTTQQPSGVRQQQRIPKRQAPARSKSSGPAYSSATTLPRTRQDIRGGDAGSSSPQPSGIKAYLRRRTATASSDDEFDSASHSVRREFATHRNSGGGRRSSGGISVCSTGSGGTNTGRVHSNPRGRGLWGIQKQLTHLSRMKLGHVLQVVIVLAVMALVYESHHKALFATSQLIQFKEEESLLLLHLQKIEQQSIQLHENLSRLARMGINGGGGSAAAVADSNGLSGGGDELEDGSDGGGGGGGGREVDFDLIHKQTQQLYQMEEELNHEVKTLQSRIQLSARNHIIQEFGEGPVQVVLELDFSGNNNNNNEQNSSGQGPHRISILLWHDTPHAAWTWLEQIGNNVWDGAEFKWQQGHIIDAVPNHIHGSNPDDGKIEFVEHSQHAHQAWTVGVRESDKGAMGMYINLQDNSDLHKHETCVGKVIDGFDALQRLLEAARGEQDSSIAIRKATAMHYVTKKAGI